MIFTYFLFFSFLSTSNKAKKNPLERKSSHFPYFLAPQKQPKWPKNEARETNLLPCGQTALATVWNVHSGHGIPQNLCKNRTCLMVLFWVQYDNYRGRYRHLKFVIDQRSHPVYIYILYAYITFVYANITNMYVMINHMHVST